MKNQGWTAGLVLLVVASVSQAAEPQSAGGGGGGPAGYTKCADEGGSHALTGRCDVAFGANGAFLYLYNQTGTVTFNTDTFGSDPAPGVFKAGYCKPVKRSADPQGILRKPIPDKLVVLTFDDGCASGATFVAPLLKSLGFGGSFYVSPCRISRSARTGT